MFLDKKPPRPVLKVGDRVIYTRLISIYGDTESNPLWGGRCGFIAGTVIEVHGTTLSVSWDNGYRNGYIKGQLDLINE